MKSFPQQQPCLPKHVTCDWRFRRCDAQSLRQNAHEIGNSAAMPQQLVVVEVKPRFEPFALGVAGNGKRVEDGQVIHVQTVTKTQCGREFLQKHSAGGGGVYLALCVDAMVRCK